MSMDSGSRRFSDCSRSLRILFFLWFGVGGPALQRLDRSAFGQKLPAAAQLFKQEERHHSKGPRDNRGHDHHAGRSTTQCHLARPRFGLSSGGSTFSVCGFSRGGTSPGRRLRRGLASAGCHIAGVTGIQTDASRPPPVSAVVDPADANESWVRLALHRLGVDACVLLAVERKGTTIRVWGVVATSEAKNAVLDALSTAPDVEVDVLSEAEEVLRTGAAAVDRGSR